ncbi:MAG: hypothetical protein IPI43_11300 [Sandaracinaceae bacterium]|nr:hypothetical protein [Sandaracinaceae bacterium]
MTKDTHEGGRRALNSFADCPGGKDTQLDLNAQTQNGLSVRALAAMLVFIKAAAYFRGNAERRVRGRAPGAALRAARTGSRRTAARPSSTKAAAARCAWTR